MAELVDFNGIFTALASLSSLGFLIYLVVSAYWARKKAMAMAEIERVTKENLGVTRETQLSVARLEGRR